jgi:uncharacterized Zn-finger protein
MSCIKMSCKSGSVHKYFLIFIDIFQELCGKKQEKDCGYCGT